MEHAARLNKFDKLPPVLNLGWNGSSRSQSLHGWREARANVFDSIDQDTVIIGHKVQDDLEIL